MLFFWFFKNCELIRDSFLWRSNFIPLVHDSIIITRLRCYTYTFGSHFDYKRWVRVFHQNLNFSFLGQVFQYFCWVSKCVNWGSHHISILFVGSQYVSIEVRITTLYIYIYIYKINFKNKLLSIWILSYILTLKIK